MNYSEAFEAVQHGDYSSAAPLLAQAATETHYTSDAINQALILALHRTGESARAVEVALSVGVDRAEDSPGMALDYFQRALIAGLDSVRAREIGVIQERWAEQERWADAAPERAHGGAVRRVANVVGELAVSSPAARYTRTLCEGFRSIGAIPAVFSTDWAVSWPFSLAGETPSEAVDFAAETWRPQSGGDFLERARSVAQAVRAFQPDIVFYHSSFFEQITARVAAFRPAPWQFHINHGEEMPVDFFAGRAHRQARALAATRYREVSAPWVPMACDIATRLADEPAVTRQAIGVDTASSVSATFGDLDQAGSPEFVSALTEILMRFPEHTHLFAGSGNVRTLRQALHAEGVLARVRFLGPVVNAASLMPSIDFYLAPFPHMDSEFVMDALGAGKPVLMHKEATDPRTGAESSLVGIDDLLASNRSAYVEAASVLIRKPPVRARLTHEVRSRFEAEYSPRRVAERYLEFIETLSAR